MKKIFSWGMMLAAAFTLTNCAKEMDAPVQEPETSGYPFEIVASTVDTKTVNDGMSTKWTDGDQINVFHALGKTTEYVNDGAFTVKDVETGVFTGTIAEQLDAEEEYDWFVMYPYSDKITTPGAKTTGYTYIGYSSGLNQTGYNSMASLKGSVCPLYGVLKYGGVSPKLTMKHLSSVVAINITNVTDEPLTITSASFTAPEDIVGSYFIDITGESVVYTPRSADYVKKTAIVNVSGGTALANGESAILYAAIKPFTAAAGQKLSLSVNGYSKEITLSKAATFSAGQIKTVNFAYDKVAEPAPEDVTIATLTFDDTAKRVEYSTSVQVWKENGITVTNNKASSTNNVGDYANPARFYKGSEVVIEAPGLIKEIIFNCSGLDSKYVTPLSDLTNATSENGIVTIALDGTSNSVSYSMSAQARAFSVTVTYSPASGGETPSPEPDPEPDPEPEPEITTENISVENFLAISEATPNVIYVVSGTIVNIQEISATYGNATLTIADDKGNELLVYRMKSAEGGIAIDQIGLTVGDVLTVAGEWGEYNGSVQMTNARYVSHEDKSEPTPEGPISVTVDEFLKASVSNVVKYRITGEIILLESFNTQYNNVNLSVKDETGEAYVYRMTTDDGLSIDQLGLTVGDILTVEGNRGDYNGSPQMTNGVYISHEDVELEEPEEPAGSVVASAVFSKLGYANAQSVDGKTITLDDNVSIVFKKAKSGTAPAYYTSGSAIRMYQNGATLDVTANGKTITEIQITFSQNHYYIAPDYGTLSAESSVRTWTGEATAVKFTTTGTDKNHRAYVSEIKVTYKD